MWHLLELGSGNQEPNGSTINLVVIRESYVDVKLVFMEIVGVKYLRTEREKRHSPKNTGRVNDVPQSVASSSKSI